MVFRCSLYNRNCALSLGRQQLYTQRLRLEVAAKASAMDEQHLSESIFLPPKIGALWCVRGEWGGSQQSPSAWQHAALASQHSTLVCHRKTWTSMGINGDTSDIHGHTWEGNPQEIRGNSMEIHGDPRDIHGNPREMNEESVGNL